MELRINAHKSECEGNSIEGTERSSERERKIDFTR